MLSRAVSDHVRLGLRGAASSAGRIPTGCASIAGMGARASSTVNDLYAFEPGVKVLARRFQDVIGRHFKQPKEGLGFDGSPVAHMWRSVGNPDSPL